MRAILVAAMVAAGSWMGQFLRTAASVPDEPPPKPRLTPVHVVPTLVVSLLWSYARRLSLVGTVLLSFNLAVVYSFIVGTEAQRRWMQEAQRG